MGDRTQRAKGKAEELRQGQSGRTGTASGSFGHGGPAEPARVVESKAKDTPRAGARSAVKNRTPLEWQDRAGGRGSGPRAQPAPPNLQLLKCGGSLTGGAKGEPTSTGTEGVGRSGNLNVLRPHQVMGSVSIVRQIRGSVRPESPWRVVVAGRVCVALGPVRRGGGGNTGVWSAGSQSTCRGPGGGSCGCRIVTGPVGGGFFSDQFQAVAPVRCRRSQVAFEGRWRRRVIQSIEMIQATLTRAEWGGDPPRVATSSARRRYRSPSKPRPETRTPGCAHAPQPSRTQRRCTRDTGRNSLKQGSHPHRFGR